MDRVRHGSWMGEGVRIENTGFSITAGIVVPQACKTVILKRLLKLSLQCIYILFIYRHTDTVVNFQTTAGQRRV